MSLPKPIHNVIEVRQKAWASMVGYVELSIVSIQKLPLDGWSTCSNRVTAPRALVTDTPEKAILALIDVLKIADPKRWLGTSDVFCPIVRQVLLGQQTSKFHLNVHFELPWEVND